MKHWLVIVLSFWSSSAAAGEKPVLDIWTSPSCIPCRTFETAWRTDASFRKAVEDVFRVNWINYDVPAWRMRAPAFVREGLPCFVDHARRKYHSGFTSTDAILNCLGIAPEPQPNSRPISQNPPNPRPVEPNALIELRSQNAELRDRIDELIASSKSDRNRYESALQDARDEFMQQLAEVSTPEPVPDPISTSETPPVATADPQPSKITEAVKVAGKTIAKAGTAAFFATYGVELTTAGTIIGGIGSWWLRGYSERRRRRRERSAGGDAGGMFPSGLRVDDSASPAPNLLPREVDEARQLLQLRQAEGRQPIHDSLFGMLAEDELRNVAETDDASASVASQLLSRIKARFDRIAPISQQPKDHAA